MSKVLFQQQVAVPGRTAHSLYEDTMKWVEKINIFGRYFVDETKEPNYIKIKYVFTSLRGLDKIYYFVFSIENEKVNFEIDDKLNGGISIMHIKLLVEDYYRFININIDEKIIKEIYNKNDLIKGIFNMIGGISTLLLMFYGMFYLLVSNQWNIMDILNIILKTLPIAFILMEVGFKPIRNIIKYIKYLQLYK